MFIRCCSVKFTVKQTILELRKNNFDFHFKAWKNKKTTGLVDGPIISNQLPQPMLLAKTPSNYQDRTVHKNEQKPINFNAGDGKRPTMVKPNEIKRTEKRKLLEKQLSENNKKMKKIKSTKLQI